MTQSEFAKKIAAKLGISLTEAERMLDAFTETIRLELVAGGEVSFFKMMTLKTINRPERAGRNPRTGADIVIPAKKVAVAKFSNTISQEINSLVAPVAPAKKYALKDVPKAAPAPAPKAAAKKPAPKKK